MSRRRHVRRTLLGLILVALLLLGGWTGLWFWVDQRLAGNLKDWEAARRAEGWAISHGTPQRAGWPMAAGLLLPDFRIAGLAQLLPGGVAWSAQQVMVALDVRHRDALILGASGWQRLRIAKGAVLPVAADRMRAQVTLAAGGRPGVTAFRAKGLAIGLRGGAAEDRIAVADLAGALALDPKAGAGSNGLALVIQAGGIALPDRAGALLGRSVSRLSGAAAISGPFARGADPAATLAAWRDGGGRLRVTDLDLRYGDLTLTGDALFGLDAGLRPDGQARLGLTGYDAALQALTHRHWLRRDEAKVLRAMLGLLAGSGADPHRVALPLTLRQGVVQLGAVPLWRLPQ